MGEEPKEKEIKIYGIPEADLKELKEGIKKVCTGIECLPELSKKIEAIKIPKIEPEKEKHQVYGFMSFCPKCGEKLRESPTEYECANCHVPVDPKTDKVCWNCGSKKARRRN